MSSVFVLKKRTSVHLMCDAAAYKHDGTLVSVNMSKAVAMPTLHAAVSCTGPAEAASYFAYQLVQHFSSFDDLIERAEDELPAMHDRYADHFRGGDASTSIYLVGWHCELAAPGAYCMNVWTDDSSLVNEALANSGADAAQIIAQRGRLETAGIMGQPMPEPDVYSAAGWRVPAMGDDAVDAERVLLHLTEVARHDRTDGRFWVGGKALLTSIDAAGITQRVVRHWEEDQVGGYIAPKPIDWTTFGVQQRAAELKAAIPEGLSRLQRERMEKKALKQARRAS